MSGLTGVVASDLEGTLTTGETWKGVGRYLATHGRGLAYRTFFALHVPGVLLARIGFIQEQRFRAEWMRAMVKLLAGLSIAEMAALSEWVVEQELWPKRRPEVLAELLRHRAAGRRVIVASGTYLPVLQAFADRMGAEALGTPLEFVAGKLTGLLAGPVNAGQAKAEQLAVYLNGGRLTTAYGDTLPDLPMLEMSAEPVVVCPAPDLQRVAVARGWRVLTG
ncbi:MAG TPA: haloacid dehalogenase-like hydrolase [Symbiobacteriaceae bacterium]|jgi:phosphoserine phosphatase